MITLGANTLGIGLAIHLRDQFTAKARAIESEFNRLHGNANKVIEDNLRAANRLGLGMAAVGGIMTAGFGKGLRAAADFEYTMKTVQLVTNATNQQMKQMEQLSVQLGTSTIFKPQDIASAMEFLGKGGFTAKQILEGTIQAVTYLGGALDKPIGGKGGVADFLQHIMHGYGIGPQGAMGVANMITKTSLASSSDLEDIHEAIKYMSASAVELNIGLDESLAMVAKLSNAGLRGGIGGRSLNNMLIQLATSLGELRTPKHEAVLQKMGLKPSDLVTSSGQLKRITDVLAILDNRLNKMPPIERVSALNALLNLRGGRAVAPLLRDNGIGGTYSQILAQIRASSGEAERISKERMKTLWGSFERLGDVMWNFFKTLGSIISPFFKPILDFVIVAVTKFTNFLTTPWGKPFVVLAAVSAVALTVMGSLLVVFTSIKLLTLTSTFTFGNMGRTLVWAWNSATAAALRYATVAKGAMMVNTPTGVRWRNIATGKWVKGPAVGGAGAAGAAGASGIWGHFLKGLSFAGRMFSWLGTILRGAVGGVGFVVTILSVLFGFRTMLRLVVLGLGTLLNSLIYVAQAAVAIIKHPIDTVLGNNKELDDAGKRFHKAQESMIEGLGLRKKGDNQEGMSFVGKRGKETIIADPIWQKLIADKQAYEKKQLTINLSGKKVGDIAWDERAKDLRTLLETKPTN